MIYILIGIITGIIGGMGIGGGTILIPTLVFFAQIPQKIAQGINLMVFLPVSAIALIIHTRHKRVKYKTSAYITIFAIVGSVIGAKAASVVSPLYLKRLFGTFLFVMGLYELARKQR